MSTRSTCLSAALLLLAACDDCDEANEPPPPAPAPAPSAAGPRDIATPASFELVATGHGALLVWGAPAEAGGAVSILSLDPLGAERGPARVLFERTGVRADAAEIAAASGAGRAGIAWVSRAQGHAAVFATHGHETGDAFAPPVDLGALDPDAIDEAAPRGAIAVAAADDGSISVMHRGMTVPCAEGERADGLACVEVSMDRLGGSPGGNERRGSGLAVPAPCARAAVGYVFAGGVWYYGVCSRAAGPKLTTVYAIQFEPQYARADPLLSGCDPLGLAPADEGAIVAARCGDARAVVELREAGQAQRAGRARAPEVTCVESRPHLTVGEITRALSAPASRLEALLPDAIAPPGARAAWTGDALLVATAVPKSHGEGPLALEVSLRRYQCAGGALERTDPM